MHIVGVEEVHAFFIVQKMSILFRRAPLWTFGNLECTSSLEWGLLYMLSGVLLREYDVVQDNPAAAALSCRHSGPAFAYRVIVATQLDDTIRQVILIFTLL